MRIGLLGTRGVPAQYGGFETAAEEIGRRLAERGHDVVVYCRNPGQVRTEYLGMRLVNLPAMRVRAAETLSHTMVSVGHALTPGSLDVAFVFNAANAPFVRPLRLAGIPVAVHVDGLEWQRAKWGPRASAYYRWAESRSARWADAVIADAQGIADHMRVRSTRPSWCIPYGAPIVSSGPSAWPSWAWLHGATTWSSPVSSRRTMCLRSSPGTSSPNVPCPWRSSVMLPTRRPTAQRCGRPPAGIPGCTCSAASGTPPAGHAVRPCRLLPARPQRGGHEPLTAPSDGRGGAGHRLRRGLQPRGRRDQRGSLPRPGRRGTRVPGGGVRSLATAERGLAGQAAWPGATGGRTSPTATRTCRGPAQ